MVFKLLFIIKLYSQIIKITVCIIISSNITYSMSASPRPNDLFTYLYEESEWELINEFPDSVLLFSKNIDEINLTAISVSKSIQIDPKIIKSIIVDVNEYKSFLSSANSLQTIEIKRDRNFLDAYQHIKIDFPLFENRQYCFRMYTDFLENKDITTLVEWYLINPKAAVDSLGINKDLDAIYLKYGAGTWFVRPMDNNRFNISYRLIMDPSGYIPSFMKEIINKISVVSLFRDVLIEAKRRSK